MISYFYKAFVQFLSHWIELILDQFLNCSAEKTPRSIFFLAPLISSSSVLLSSFDTHIIVSQDTKTFLYSKRE